MYDLIVLGAGPGGYEAAAYAGKMGMKVALIEKEYIGGVCLNEGCIPTKTMIHSANVLQSLREAENYGIKTAKTEIDYDKIQNRKKEVISILTKGVENKLKRSGIEIIWGKGYLKAKDTVSVNNKDYKTKNILIATGSRPAIPPIEGINSKKVMDSGAILDLAEIPESLVIIGAGAIGLEFAYFFNTAGTKVKVIEMLSEIAIQMDKEISSYLLKSLKSQGIDFSLGSKVIKIDNNGISYTCEDGKTETVKSEFILNATGRKPNLEDIGLDEVGVFYDSSGIKTDLQGKTNVYGIWACGDVTGRCLLAHAATREGIVAVNNMLGKKDIMRYRAIPNVIYTNPEVASAGMTEEILKQEGIGYKKNIVSLNVSGRFVAENEKKEGYVKVLTGDKYNEILGIHIIGDSASEMIYGAATFIEMEMTIDDVMEIVFPHPTVSEAIKEAICQIK
ncbi:MAG: dihydrolipoyl dehydrogenase [Actinomycetota bacterium]|jgi:dihydrolipoamide dehydrogenase|nr:dihydrolipoyl dehydrogenase [Actinomycetota bacterium]MDD5600190.1 dihydrolipoyl dehydrogenase [Actinomycetota bacterium]